MKKKLWILGFSLVTMILVGCGQVSQQTGGIVEEPASQVQIKETVVASTKLTISMTGNEGSGYQTSAIETTRIASQSVEIEANVPGFMTFDVNSTISFDVNQLAWIEANGYIQINVTYNQWAEVAPEGLRVRAYMVGADGLVGQLNDNNIIPLEVEVTAPPMIDPFSPLTTATRNIKEWDKPFNQAINEVILLRLKGDFSGALNQQFKGTIMLEFVRDDEVDDTPPPSANTVLLLHMDGDANSFIDSSMYGHSLQVYGAAAQVDVAGAFGKAAQFSNSYVSLVLNNISLDSGDWTVDCRINTNDNTQNGWFFSYGAYVNEDMINMRALWGELDFTRFDQGSTSGRTNITGINSFIQGKWYHTAIEKYQDNIYFYIDGVVQGSIVDNNTWNSSIPIRIGCGDDTGSNTTNPAYYYNGYVDELRIVKGQAMYKGQSFTPPTQPYN